MKSIKKLITIPLAAIAIYGITSCTQISPYSVEFGQGYSCETRAKENRIKFFKDGKLIGEKNKTKHGEEYWFVDKEGFRYEETEHHFRVIPPEGYTKKAWSRQYWEDTNQKIKDGKEMLEELKKGEKILEERVNTKKQKKEPKQAGTAQLNKIEEKTSEPKFDDASDYMVGVSFGLEEYLKEHKPIKFIIIY